VTTPTAPKYRTTTQACSCLGFWYRRTCKHYRAYREAVALVLAQDAANLTWARLRVATGLYVALRVITILDGWSTMVSVIVSICDRYRRTSPVWCGSTQPL
jgi:hypothetical protein